MASQNEIIYLDKTVSRENLKEDLEYLCRSVKPSWKTRDITFERLSGGLVNDIYHCKIAGDDKDDDAVIVRLYTIQDIESQVNRDVELCSMQIAHAAGVAEPVYAILNNGLVYGYATGKTGHWGLLWDDHTARLYMRNLCKLHQTDPSKLQLIGRDGKPKTLEKKIDIFDTLRDVAKQVPQELKNYPERNDRLKKLWSSDRIIQELTAVEEHLALFGFPVVFCHNDSWVPNVVYDGKRDKLSFIDYEFSGFRYEASDLALLLNCFKLFETYVRCFPEDMLKPSPEELKLPRTEEHNRKLTRFYLEEKYKLQGKSVDDITQEDFDKFYQQTQMLDIVTYLMWGTFGMIQLDDPTTPWDALGYVEDVFKKYEQEREKLFSFKC